MRSSKRIQIKGMIITGSILAALLLLIGSSFAWYLSMQRKAASEELNVMKPYYLTLLKPNEKDELQLAIGNLYPGETKQTVFCVSNAKIIDGSPTMEMGESDFDYEMELVHTENLTLQYDIYELKNVETEGESDITTEEDNGSKKYWKKLAPKLTGADVSKKRWVQTELADTEATAEADTKNIINRGLYHSFTTGSNGENLHLTAGTETIEYKPGYFVMEVKWDSSENVNFSQYEKETDMIYILVKALQPEPKPKTTP